MIQPTSSNFWSSTSQLPSSQTDSNFVLDLSSVSYLPSVLNGYLSMQVDLNILRLFVFVMTAHPQSIVWPVSLVTHFDKDKKKPCIYMVPRPYFSFYSWSFYFKRLYTCRWQIIFSYYYAVANYFTLKSGVIEITGETIPVALKPSSFFI